MPSASPVVHTLGHSTHPSEVFLALLRNYEIQEVADIRRYPVSRRNPQYSHEELGRLLHDAGLRYRHWVELGGRRSPRTNSPNGAWRNDAFRGYADHMATPNFQSSLSALVREAARTSLTVLCAEAVPWRCHRNLLSDALVVSGVRVLHILPSGKAEPHRPSPQLRVVDGTITYPGMVPRSLGARGRQSRLTELGNGPGG